jgi:hypothetical protein
VSPRKRAVCNLGEVFGGGRARAAAPQGFTWRGLRFSPPVIERGGFYKSIPIELADDRTAEWKVQCLEPHAWHARLRIGGDRFPGVGATPAEALEAAAAEAQNVAAFIVAMLPASSPTRQSKRKPRAITVRR